MFERFTDRSRRVVVLAQEEARMLSHDYIGPEHILLALVHEGEGVAARALKELGVSLPAVREQIEELVGRGQHERSGHIPFTPRAKRVLELSLREALQLGHNYIGTEHILLGILREGENVAAQVLVRMGTDLNRVRVEVVKLVGPGEAGAGTPEGGPSGEARMSRRAVARDPLLAEVRDALAGISERLAAIERHLGLNAGAQDPGGPPGQHPGPANGEPSSGPPGDKPHEPAAGKPDGPQAGKPDRPQASKPDGPQGSKPDEPPGAVTATGD
jgi:ATP-dependent Clp protease ATP-binding subunit ClpA